MTARTSKHIHGTGSIEESPSGRFRVRAPDGRGGYRRVGTYATYNEARRMLEAALIVAASSPVMSALCFANYAERVIDRWKLAGKQTYREDRSRLATMVVPHAEWTQLPLDQITRGEVRQWSTEDAKARARQTVRQPIDQARTQSRARGLRGRDRRRAHSDESRRGSYAAEASERRATG